METAKRRALLIELLQSHNKPLTGTELASLCQVTRQVVVHDVALLRAKGYNILSTLQGYYIPEVELENLRTVLAVYHPPELTQLELTLLVDRGLIIEDVVVEHPIYGELQGSLQIASRRDVDLFIMSLQKHRASLLSVLTDGYHLHTVGYKLPDQLSEAIVALQENGIQVLAQS